MSRLCLWVFFDLCWNVYVYQCVSWWTLVYFCVWGDVLLILSSASYWFFININLEFILILSSFFIFFFDLWMHERKKSAIVNQKKCWNHPFPNCIWIMSFNRLFFLIISVYIYKIENVIISLSIFHEYYIFHFVVNIQIYVNSHFIRMYWNERCFYKYRIET